MQERRVTRQLWRRLMVFRPFGANTRPTLSVLVVFLPASWAETLRMRQVIAKKIMGGRRNHMAEEVELAALEELHLNWKIYIL